jgi:hypothetical protein
VHTFDRYIALGDSMSIDLYPMQDARSEGLVCRDAIGAAALFYENDPDLYPEMCGLDLLSRYPDIRFANHATDGATIDLLLTDERTAALDSALTKHSLISLTVGGNDLLAAFHKTRGQEPLALAKAVFDLFENYEKLLTAIGSRITYDNAVIVSTIYDPTDDTGIMPVDSPLYQGDLPLEFLHRFNEHIRVSARKKGFILADLHRHFLGHGATCGSSEQFWYWKTWPIEPSYRGADQIRKIWLAALDQHFGNEKDSRLPDLPITSEGSMWA